MKFCPECGFSQTGSGRFCGGCGGALPEFPLAPEVRLDGERYQIEKLLKVGGMGAVYQARDHRLNKPVALKQLLPGQTDAYAHERFDAEGNWLSRLSHPALPRVTDTFEDAGSRFHVMDLIEGQDLETVLESGPLSWDRVRPIALQLLEVLEFLHGLDPPVVYRDLKPANVILRTDGQVALVDFGLARPPSPATATAIGTEGYCPLEQYQGRAEPRSDLYALGATLYHLLTGRCPQPLRYERDPSLPSTLESVLARAMALQAEQRYPGARAMREALIESERDRPRANDGSELIWVEAGPALVGSDDNPMARPAHQVRLEGFWIDRVPVTQAQFRAYLQATGRSACGPFERFARPGRDDHPAVGVSLQDARDYCAWAGKRLPTEDEWEKAARGAEGRRYPWGEQFASSRCRHAAAETAPVGSFPEGNSPYGCQDMSGNVWEWTEPGPDGAWLKGGSWSNRDPQTLECAARLRGSPESADERRGFRGVCERPTGQAEEKVDTSQ